MLWPHPGTSLIVHSHFAWGSRLPVLPHRRNASIRFDFGTLSLLSLSLSLFDDLLFAACRVEYLVFCLDGKLQGFWHSFTALHPCTWFVQPKCLIKRRLRIPARFSHSISLPRFLVLELPLLGQQAKYSISSTMKYRISAMQMDSQARFVCELVGWLCCPVGGTWMR